MEKLDFAGYAATGFDPLMFARMKADMENKRKKPDDGLGLPCDLCGGGGYLMDIREDGSLYSRPCSCSPMRQARLRLKRAGMLERVERDTFPAFAATEPFQKDMKVKAMDFCRAEKKGWLMICGQPGCGKTHLCVAVVGQLAKQGYDIQVLPWVNVAMELKSPDADRVAILAKYRAAPVLYIDDLLKGNQTNTGYEAAFGLLNDRYNDSSLITIISTERTPEELGQFDQAIRGRIVERCGNHISVVAQAPGRDYRLKRTQPV